MKKKNYRALLKVVLIFLLLSSFTKNQNLEDKQEKNKLNGLQAKVKSYTNFTYTAINRFGKIVKGERKKYSNHKIKYDEQGNEIEVIYYNADGSLDWKTITLYNAKGNKIESWEHFSNKKIKSNKYTYQYDNSDNLIEINKSKSDGTLIWKSTLIYNKKGKLIEKKRYKSDGSLENKFTHKYDSLGNETKLSNYDASGALNWFSTYQYDENKNVIEEQHYNSSGELDTRVNFKFDCQGNIIERCEYNSDKIILRKTISKYDEKENVIESIDYESDGELLKYFCKYIYDEKGNWIKQIEYEGNIPIIIVEREYEYYK